MPGTTKPYPMNSLRTQPSTTPPTLMRHAMGAGRAVPTANPHNYTQTDGISNTLAEGGADWVPCRRCHCRRHSSRLRWGGQSLGAGSGRSGNLLGALLRPGPEEAEVAGGRHQRRRRRAAPSGGWPSARPAARRGTFRWGGGHWSAWPGRGGAMGLRGGDGGAPPGRGV